MKRKPHKITHSKFSDSIDTLVSLFSQGRYAEVEALARELTVRFPQEGTGWKVLGVMLALQGEKAEALEPMRKAAELLPGDVEVHYNLANVLQEQGRLAEAESSYRRAISIKPDIAEAHNKMADFLPFTDQLLIAGQSGVSSSAGVKMNWTAFEPRVGLVWKVLCVPE